MNRFVMVAVFALSLCACGADDGTGDGGSGPTGTVAGPGLASPPSDDDPSQDDGSGWPRWKNPCPGPACDPYRNDPRWIVDPPPDIVERPVDGILPSGIGRSRLDVRAAQRIAAPQQR